MPATLPAWKYLSAASLTDAAAIPRGPKQAQNGNYEACPKKEKKKYSFLQAGGKKKWGGGRTSVSAEQPNLSHTAAHT